MKTTTLILTPLLLLLAALPVTRAQQVAPPPIVPSRVVVEPTLPEKSAPAPALAQTKAPKTEAATKGGIMLNFQGASLTDVLNYLSEVAGFVVVQEAQINGTVNVVSRQPISAEEAVDLLNAVLIEKGYVAIRNGRILKIVNRKDAQRRDLPVQMGSDPELIPRKDEMVTQILPVRFGEAAKLVENIRPLLAENATISANEGSNSILLTDTLTNIRRIAQIIRAIDTSVAGISTIHVYPLQYADAKELATVITQLFANDSTSSSRSRSSRSSGGGGPPGFPGGFGPGGFSSGGSSSSAAQSEARQAASRVIAVADEQSNSLIVSAPEEIITTITDIVARIDTSITDITDTRIFRLEHADAVEMADILTTLYASSSSQNSQSSRSSRSRDSRSSGGYQGPTPFGPGFSPPGSSSSGNQQSERALLESQVIAVGDPRTNSLLVTAARDMMASIAEMIGRLDATDAKKQNVYVHSLEHADADSVANVLRGMLGDQTAITNSSQSGANRLSERTSTGATMDTTTQSSSTNNRSTR